MGVGNLLKRKITASFVTTMVTSMLLASFYIANGITEEPVYNLGTSFLGWVYVYSLYVGAVILTYGNLVSIGIEYLKQKGFIQRTHYYIFLHGVFGLANGLFFQEPLLAVYGMAAAAFYGLIDRWIYRRTKIQKRLRTFYLFPTLICGVLWGYFQIVSEPIPPFTAEDAVDHATNSSGTIIDSFPKHIGKWEGVIDGYQVERETAAKEIGKERYIITFTEKWEKGEEEGSLVMVYEVDRNSLTAQDLEWNEPPYYR